MSHTSTPIVSAEYEIALILTTQQLPGGNTLFHNSTHVTFQQKLGQKKILFVSDFRPTLSKHARPKFILCISKKYFFFFFFLGNL